MSLLRRSRVATVAVPDLAGLSVRQAHERLRSAGLEPAGMDEGQVVIWQQPAARTQANRGDRVELWTGTPDQVVREPNSDGGLNVGGNLAAECSTGNPRFDVMFDMPMPDSLLPGPHRGKREVPDFIGRRASETFRLAANAGLRTNFVLVSDRPAAVDGRVVAQDPPPGTRVKHGTTIELRVVHEADAK